jgi:hypothetical protein
VAVIIVGGWQLAMILEAFLIVMFFVRVAIVGDRHRASQPQRVAPARDRHRPLAPDIHIAMRKLGEDQPMRRLAEEPAVAADHAGPP